MVVFAAMLLLFYVFYSLYISQATISIQANEKLSAMRVASGVRAAINYVYLAGDGTVYNTSLRTSGLNVTISNGVVGVESRYAGYYLPLLTTKINATSIGPGDLVIRNDKGAILIG